MDDFDKQKRVDTYRKLKALDSEPVEVEVIDVIEDVDGIPISVDGSIEQAALVITPAAFGLTEKDVESDDH